MVGPLTLATPLTTPTVWFVPVTFNVPLLLTAAEMPPAERAETLPANCSVAPLATATVTPVPTVGVPLVTSNANVPELTFTMLLPLNVGAPAIVSVLLLLLVTVRFVPLASDSVPANWVELLWLTVNVVPELTTFNIPAPVPERSPMLAELYKFTVESASLMASGLVPLPSVEAMPRSRH